MRILFVCLGNICRSPMAEAIFNHEASKRGWKGKFIAESCGTANYHVGHNPDRRTIKIAQNHGVPVSHKGRQFMAIDFHTYDLILPMDFSNESHLKGMSNSEHLDKIRLTRSFEGGTELEVPDPYYGNDEDFEEVFQILNRSMDGLFDFLENKHT